MLLSSGLPWTVGPQRSLPSSWSPLLPQARVLRPARPHCHLSSIVVFV